MKQWVVIIGLFFSFSASSQSFIGTWEGRLQISNSLRIVFIFGEKNGNVSATWQSPDQTKAILPTDTCYVMGDSIFDRQKIWHRLSRSAHQRFFY